MPGGAVLRRGTRLRLTEERPQHPRQHRVVSRVCEQAREGTPTSPFKLVGFGREQDKVNLVSPSSGHERHRRRTPLPQRGAKGSPGVGEAGISGENELGPHPRGNRIHRQQLDAFGPLRNTGRTAQRTGERIQDASGIRGVVARQRMQLDAGGARLANGTLDGLAGETQHEVTRLVVPHAVPNRDPGRRRVLPLRGHGYAERSGEARHRTAVTSRSTVWE